MGDFLSRAVDGIDGDRPENGILLVDMKYSFIEEMMNQVNDQNRGDIIMSVMGKEI